ncbi:MAG: septum formation initiator family protein [Nitrospirota bacterium]
MIKRNLSSQEREIAIRRRVKIAIAAGACLVFYAFLSFFLGQMGFIRYVELCHQRDHIKAEIVQLKASSRDLRAQVDSLRTDPDSIESLARDQGLVKDGETVYQYEDE